MKVKKFLFTAFLLTLLLFGVMAGSLFLKKDYEILIMLNFVIMEYAAGSWLLALIDAFLYMLNKPYILGIKSYKVLTILMLIGNIVFGVVSVFTEGGFKGSSAEMMLIYLLPAFIAVWIILEILDKKYRKRGNDK